MRLKISNQEVLWLLARLYVGMRNGHVSSIQENDFEELAHVLWLHSNQPVRDLTGREIIDIFSPAPEAETVAEDTSPVDVTDFPGFVVAD